MSELSKKGSGKSPKKTGEKAKKPAATKAPRADRSKRLLDLVMTLLRARAPVSYREIREQFPAYQTVNIEAGLRAFERDKADLLELGVPVRYITPEEDTSVEDGGYVIELKKYRLPEVRLTPDEISALVLATSVARAVPGIGYARVCDLAVRKLAFDYPEPDTPLAWPPQQGRISEHEPVLVHFPESQGESEKLLSERFTQLEAATRNRKKVSLNYRSASTGLVQSRELDPYGLFYRDQSWLVVGYCHLRKDIQSFRLDRIDDMKVGPKPKSPDFERPEDFDVRAFASRSPWTFSPQPVETVEIELSAEAQSAVNEDYGAHVETTEEGELVRVRFESGNPDYIVSRILASKGSMRLLSGDNAKKKLADEIAAIEEMYS